MRSDSLKSNRVLCTVILAVTLMLVLAGVHQVHRSRLEAIADAETLSGDEMTDSVGLMPPQEKDRSLRTEVSLHPVPETSETPEVHITPTVQRRPVGGTPPGRRETSKTNDQQRTALNVSRIVAETPADYRERLTAVYALRMETLDDEQIHRLLAYLEDTERDNALPDHLFHVLVNELVAFFHKQDRIDSRYLESSYRIIDDDLQDEVVRDYTLQGFSHAMDAATPEQARQIEAVFWENTTRNHVSLAGTSLLALNRLQLEERLTPENTQRLQNQVSEYLQAADSPGEPTRIVALQIAAQQNLHHTLEPAKAALRAGELTPSETVAVLGLLSRFEDPDLPMWLEHFQTDSHPILRQSAQRMAALSIKP